MQRGKGERELVAKGKGRKGTSCEGEREKRELVAKRKGRKGEVTIKVREAERGGE